MCICFVQDIEKMFIANNVVCSYILLEHVLSCLKGFLNNVVINLNLKKAEQVLLRSNNKYPE